MPVAASSLRRRTARRRGLLRAHLDRRGTPQRIRAPRNRRTTHPASRRSACECAADNSATMCPAPYKPGETPPADRRSRRSRSAAQTARRRMDARRSSPRCRWCDPPSRLSDAARYTSQRFSTDAATSRSFPRCAASNLRRWAILLCSLPPWLFLWCFIALQNGLHQGSAHHANVADYRQAHRQMEHIFHFSLS
jgi:hypothetical protein